MILLDIEVFAMLIKQSFPMLSVLMVRCSWIYLQASLREKQNNQSSSSSSGVKIYSLASQSVSAYHRSRMDLLLHQFICIFEELGSHNDLKKLYIDVKEHLHFICMLFDVRTYH